MDIKQLQEIIDELSLRMQPVKKFRIHCLPKAEQLIKDAICKKYNVSTEHCPNAFYINNNYIELTVNYWMNLNDNEIKVETLPNDYQIY